MNIEILPPDVNTSFPDFRALDNNHIAYGLAAVKNMGSKAASALSNFRSENGEYKTVYDVCCIDSNVINRKTLESLIQSGACDTLEGHRAQHFSIIDDALRWGQKYNMDSITAQENLFGGDSSCPALAPPKLPDTEKWSTEECLKREKDILGFYLSGDPLEKYMDDLNEFANIDLAHIPKKKPKEIKIGGIICNVNNRYDKNNRPWAIVELNGGVGKADIFVFNEIFNKYKELLKNDACVFNKGFPSNREDDGRSLKMVADDIYPLGEIRKKLSQYVNIIFDTNAEEILLNRLKNLTKENSGECRLMFHLKAENGRLRRIRAGRFGVNPTSEFIFQLRELYGQKNVWIS